jgi:hypothetical protein
VTIEVSPAPDGFAIVRNLFALYAHDMSAFVGLDVGDDGAFSIPASVASYWNGPDAVGAFPVSDSRRREACRIRVGPADCGEPRHLRYGRILHPAKVPKIRDWPIRGAHAVRPLRRILGGARTSVEPAAQTFWRRIIGDYTHGTFTEGQEFFAAHGREFIVQRFRTSR